MPNVPTLSTIAIIKTAVAGFADVATPGSQVCRGHSGALTANAVMNPRNNSFWIAGSALRAASASVRKSSVPSPPASAETTKRPTTAASMTRPPNRLYNKNFKAARERSVPPYRPMRK